MQQSDLICNLGFGRVKLSLPSNLVLIVMPWPIVMPRRSQPPPTRLTGRATRRAPAGVMGGRVPCPFPRAVVAGRAKKICILSTNTGTTAAAAPSIDRQAEQIGPW